MARPLHALLALVLTAIALRELSRAPEWRAVTRPGWDREGVAAAGQAIEPLSRRFPPGTRVGYLGSAPPARRAIASHWLAPLVLVRADASVAAFLCEITPDVTEADLLARLPAGRDWQAPERLGDRYLWITERAK